MKLLLTNFHDGDGGGHTTYLLALAARLAAAHEVHVAAPATSRLLQEAQRLPGVHAHVQSFPNGLGALGELRHARARLHALIARTGVDVVHVNGSADHRLVLSAVRGLARRPRVVLTKHNSKAMTGLGHWWRARRTDAVIAVSRHTLEAISVSNQSFLEKHEIIRPCGREKRLTCICQHSSINCIESKNTHIVYYRKFTLLNLSLWHTHTYKSPNCSPYMLTNASSKSVSPSKPNRLAK